MRVFQRPATTSMGFLAQTEAESIAEMLAAPASIGAYTALVFAAISKANEGLYLARDGEIEKAKQAVLYSSSVGAPTNEQSAAYLNTYAENMLRKLHSNGEISDQLFDQLFRTFHIPAVKSIGEASVAIIRGKDAILRGIDWIGSFFVTFESEADKFINSEAAKLTRLYTGVLNRNRTLSSLVNVIKANALFLPNTARTLPVLENELSRGLKVQAGIESGASEAGVTAEMLRGETALGYGGVVRVIPWAKLAQWLKPIFIKIRFKKLSAIRVAKILWFVGRPLVSTFKWGSITYAAGWVFGFAGHHHQMFEMLRQAVKEDADNAQSGNKPAQNSAADALRDLAAAEKVAREAVDSAKRDFPGEAALLDQGTGDTAWVLYALGGGALVIGLYLYFNQKSQIES